jgi:hypothetical protein
MGSATFAAQYQQAPVPPGGNMIDWGWFGWYEPNNHRDFEEIVISWDTAMKTTELSDYSVGTVWGIWWDYTICSISSAFAWTIQRSDGRSPNCTVGTLGPHRAGTGIFDQWAQSNASFPVRAPIIRDGGQRLIRAGRAPMRF